MDPLAVILIASFSALLSLGVGGLAIRAILNNKLITIASHNEHIAQWRDQVAGLRLRLTEQEAAHSADMDRTTAASERRIVEALAAADRRVADRDVQLERQGRERDSQVQGMSRELDRLHAALALADESYRTVTKAQLHGQDSALRVATAVIRSSPLFDPDRHPEIPAMVVDDGRANGTGGPDGR